MSTMNAMDARDRALADADDTIRRLTAEHDAARSALADRHQADTREAAETAAAAQERIADLESEVTTLRGLNKEFDSEIGARDRRLGELGGRLAAAEEKARGDRKFASEQWTEIHMLRDRLAAQDKRVAELEAAAPRETSASISAWQDETFGPATTTLRRVIDTDETMFSAMWRAKNADRSTPRPNLSRAVRAVEELAQLIHVLVERDDDPDACAEVADVQIVLAGISAAHGQEQAALVDAKMKINRARKWRLTGDGHGQHVAKEQG